MKFYVLSQSGNGDACNTVFIADIQGTFVRDWLDEQLKIRLGRPMKLSRDIGLATAFEIFVDTTNGYEENYCLEGYDTDQVWPDGTLKSNNTVYQQ